MVIASNTPSKTQVLAVFRDLDSRKRPKDIRRALRLSRWAVRLICVAWWRRRSIDDVMRVVGFIRLGGRKPRIKDLWPKDHLDAFPDFKLHNAASALQPAHAFDDVSPCGERVLHGRLSQVAPVDDHAPHGMHDDP